MYSNKYSINLKKNYFLNNFDTVSTYYNMDSPFEPVRLKKNTEAIYSTRLYKNTI